jgi:hypothetical protein
MKRLLIIVAILFFAAISLSAATLTVTWADGNVQVQKGSAWVGVEVGDRLDSSSTVRLASGAMVELTDGQRKISLTATGSFLLDSLLKQGANVAKKKEGAMDKLGKLVDPKVTTGSTTVAAVRGAAIEPSKDTVTWMSDSVDVAAVMEEGRAFARDGDFVHAAQKFDEAAGAADGEDKDQATYDEAWALAASDSSAQAVKLLRAMPAEGIWAAPRALLLARLDIDSSAKPEAVSLIQSGLAAKLFVGDDVDFANSLLAEASAN